MEKIFMIKDKSGRAEPFTTTETHIRKYWDLNDTDDNEIVLNDFLNECDRGSCWETSSEKIMYIDFNINLIYG